MLKTYAIVITFAISCTTFAQQPSPCPTPHRAKAGPPKQVSQCCQQNTCTQQSGTEDHPLVVKLAQTNQAEGKAAANETITPHNPNQGWSLADVIAAIAGGAGLLQFLALVATIGIMIRNGHRQLRAYVVAELGTIVNVADPDPIVGTSMPTEARVTHPGWGPIVQIQIKNTGQTPAYDVVHWASLYFTDYPLPEPTNRETENDKFRSIMGQGVPITKNLFFVPRLTPEQVKGLKDGSSAICVDGEILYKDAFKKSHFTRYRLIYHRQGGAIGVSTTLSFAENGNFTDDNQPRWWVRIWRRPSSRRTEPKTEERSQQAN